MTTQRLFVPGRPLLLNAERSMHLQRARAVTRTIRNVAAVLARSQRLESVDRVVVIAEPHVKDRRRQDVGACFPTVKASIDGLVDAGILPADDDAHVLRLSFDPVVLRSPLGDGLLLTLEGRQ